jgi:hypothetical protein
MLAARTGGAARRLLAAYHTCVQASSEKFIPFRSPNPLKAKNDWECLVGDLASPAKQIQENKENDRKKKRRKSTH